jgi:hypothetical protein
MAFDIHFKFYTLVTTPVARVQGSGFRKEAVAGA